MPRKRTKLPTFWVIMTAEGYPLTATMSFTRAQAKATFVWLRHYRMTEKVESQYAADSKSLYRVQQQVWNRLERAGHRAVKVNVTPV